MSSSPPVSTVASPDTPSSRLKTMSSPISVMPSGQQIPGRQRPLSEMIGEAFPSFDHQSSIVTPFHKEAERDLIFERELSSMLLEALLESHAWASARPKHESSLAAQNIERKIVSVIEAEKQQDKTRQQLNQFIAQIKTALATLTGLGI